MLIYRSVISLFWIIFVVYWLTSALSAKKTIKRSRWTITIRIVALIVIILVLRSNAFANFDATFLTHPSDGLGIIGMIVCGLGIALAIWARAYLGKNWGAPMSIKENAELITSGPYKYIRHPIYAGVILAMLGSALVGDAVWLIAIIIFLPYFILVSARKEEQNMTKLFPAEYPEYKKKTKMVIPFVL